MTTDEDEVIDEIEFNGQDGSSEEPMEEYVKTKPYNPPKEWLKKTVRSLGEKGNAAARKAVELKGRYDAYESARREKLLARLAQESEASQYRAQISEANRSTGVRQMTRMPMAQARRITTVGQQGRVNYFAGGNPGSLLSSGARSQSLLTGGMSRQSSLLSGNVGNHRDGRSQHVSYLSFGSSKKSSSLLPSFSLGGSSSRRRKTRRR